MKRDSVLVCTVLPTYNERDNIGPLIDRILASAITPHVVLVVDDDSPDATWQVVEEKMALYNIGRDEGAGAAYGSSVKVVLSRRIGESGLTSAIQHGIDFAITRFGANVITWMDCDLSMPPEDLPKLVAEVVERHTDLAVGSRWIAGGADVAHGFTARLLSWVINQFARFMLGRQLHDYTSGFIAGRATLFQQIRLNGDYGEYCIDLLARAVRMGFTVREIPYICVPRTAGDSKTGANLWHYLVRGRKYVATILMLRSGR